MYSSAGSTGNHAPMRPVDGGAGANNHNHNHNYNHNIDPNQLNAAPKCWGCQKFINGGSAIQFADGVWHIECFQCTTCGKVIEFDSNLLFLADGKPICPECSYCCSLCKKPIFDEAIVTVEGTYHSECFRCTNCKQRIQGKSFAKTSQGVIYCVGCYAERRERKKAARRRREHHIMEEKILPSLPAEAAVVSPDSKRSVAEQSPTPTASMAEESPVRPQQQQSSQRRGGGPRNSADFAASGPDLLQSAAGSPRSSLGPQHLPPGSSAFAASAPVSPQGAKTKEASKPSGNDDAPHQQQQQPSEKADEKQAEKQPTPPPTIDLPLGTDLGIEAALAWTEDIGALEENFVRFSMRAASVYKPATPADAVAGGGGSVATSPGRTKHRSQDNGGDRVPSVGRSMSVKKYQKQHPRAANAGPQQQHQQQLVGRNRSVSSASGNFVPPGLRSRDQTAGGDAQKDVGGKEWLSNATVPQLKEELLVNYGQLCRLEASYQKLRDLYASVIDQLLQTREAMHQERGKRMEFESILRNYYGYVPPESQETSQQQQKQQQQQQLPAMKQSASSTSASAVPASSSSRHRVPATSGGAATTTKQQQQSARNAHAQQQQQGGMHRQPSLRRQRQTRKQHDPAADHNNDSGSDAEDAIITTVPQKATKRFIWPFGGSHSDNSHQGGSGIQAPNGGSGAGGGAGSGGSGKNSEDHGSRRQQHSFHMTSTFRAGKCDHCQERFKTFTNSVVRCRTCGFVCHQKCTGEVTASCNGSAAGQQHYEAGKEAAFDASVPFQAHALFGRDLVEQAASENRSVPWVVQAAVAFIEAEGIGMEGVYRRSGSTMDIREVQMQIGRVAQQTGNRFDVPAAAHAIADADMDVASVTSVLKQYFRDLPNPLMTSATYNLWVQAANISTPEDRVKVYRTISDSMPTAHAQTLRFLMTHLKRVADGQRENKMTTNNLSVVFAPNILHMGKGDMLQEMANMSNINKTVSFVIQHAEEIWDDAQFGGPEEDKEGESQSRQEETAAPALAPLPFMAVPPMRRQRGGGRVSDALLGDSEVLSSPSSPVHQPVATEETRADDGGLSQSMPSPTGLFLPEQQHHATGGSSGGGGLLVYSQQQTGYGSSAVHPRGSFDLHRTK